MHAAVDVTPNRDEPITSVMELRTGDAVRPDVFECVRRRVMLEFCKWDPQVEDTATLSPFPLLVRRRTWQHLAKLAESATAELLAAEEELLNRAELHGELGLPRAIRRVLRRGQPASPTAVRVMRFDFHPTTDGWVVSEVNSDVPGGFTESSSFTALMSEHFAASPAGCPVDAWADGIARAGQPAALLYAPGILDDMQIMAYLRDRLAERGIKGHLAKPQQLRFSAGRAYLASGNCRGSLGVVVRFFQAEWLPRAGRRRNWAPLFTGGRTPLANPGTAILTESKRFSLIMDQLRTPMPTWRMLLPETRDPREVRWRTDDGWILKAAFCNTGEAVCMRQHLEPRTWRKVRSEIVLFPGRWVAQRRFDVTPLDSPIGRTYPCIGVYTIDGKAAGIYGRFSTKPLIDYKAVDAAVLVEDEF